MKKNHQRVIIFLLIFMMLCHLFPPWTPDVLAADTHHVIDVATTPMVVIDKALVEATGTSNFLIQGTGAVQPYSITVSGEINVTIIFENVEIDRSNPSETGNTVTGAFDAGKRLGWVKSPAADGTATEVYVPTCPLLITNGANVKARFDGTCVFKAGGNGYYATANDPTTLRRVDPIGGSYYAGYAGIQIDKGAALNIISATDLTAYGAFQRANTFDESLKVNPTGGTAPSTINDRYNGGGAGIGGGAHYGTRGVTDYGTAYHDGTPGEIVISGGNVRAVGGHLAAGIGGAVNSAATTSKIEITGGDVTAVGGTYACGIGDGDSKAGSSSDYFYSDENRYEIIIRGGTVKAYGGYCAAGIGTTDEVSQSDNSSDHNGKYSGISILLAGGHITAQSGEASGDSSLSAAIGAGEQTDMLDNSITIYAEATIAASSFSNYAISNYGAKGKEETVPVVNIDPDGFVYLARFENSRQTERVFHLYAVKRDRMGNPMVTSIPLTELYDDTPPDTAGEVFYALNNEPGNENYGKYYRVDENGQAIDENGNSIPENNPESFYYPEKFDCNLSYYFLKNEHIGDYVVPPKYKAVALTLPDPSLYGGYYVMHVPYSKDGKIGNVNDDIFVLMQKPDPGTTSGEIDPDYKMHHIASGSENTIKSTNPNITIDAIALPLKDLDVDIGETQYITEFTETTFGYTVYVPTETTAFELSFKFAQQDAETGTSVTAIELTGGMTDKLDKTQIEALATVDYAGETLKQYSTPVTITGSESEIWIRKTDTSEDGNFTATAVYKVSVIVKPRYSFRFEPLTKIYDGEKVSAVIQRMFIPGSGFTDYPPTTESTRSQFSITANSKDNLRDDKITGEVKFNFNRATVNSVTTLPPKDSFPNIDGRVIIYQTVVTYDDKTYTVLTRINLDQTTITQEIVGETGTRLHISGSQRNGYYLTVENATGENGEVTASIKIQRARNNQYTDIGTLVTFTSSPSGEVTKTAKNTDFIEKQIQTLRALITADGLTETTQMGITSEYWSRREQTPYTVEITGNGNSKSSHSFTYDEDIYTTIRLVVAYNAEEDKTALLTDELRDKISFVYYKDLNKDGLLNPDEENTMFTTPPKDAGSYAVRATLIADEFEATGTSFFIIQKRSIRITGIENWLTYESKERLGDTKLYPPRQFYINTPGKIYFSNVIASDDGKVTLAGIADGKVIEGEGNIPNVDPFDENGNRPFVIRYRDDANDGYADDANYRYNKILVINAKLADDSAGADVNKNYDLVYGVAGGDDDYRYTHYLPGQIAYATDGAIFRKDTEGTGEGAGTTTPWRKFYPVDEEEYLHYDAEEADARIDYHSPKSNQHSELVKLHTVGNGETEARYAADIEFGALQFTFSKTVWDVNNYEYQTTDDSLWYGNDNVNNAVTVKNYSNKKVEFTATAVIDFGYGATNSSGGIIATLKKSDQASLNSEEYIAVAAAKTEDIAPNGDMIPPQEVIYLVLSGTPQITSETYIPIGALTIMFKSTPNRSVDETEVLP